MRLPFPIGVRLFIGFLVVIFVTGAIVLVAIAHISGLGSILSELPQKELAEVHTLWRMRILMSGLETDLRHVLLDNEPEKYLRNMREKEKSIQEYMETYRYLHPSLSKDEEQLLDELTTRYRSFEGTAGSIIMPVPRGQETKVGALLLDTWEERHQATLDTLTRLLIYEDQEIERKTALALARSLSGRRMIATLAVVGAVLSLALAVGITVSLTKPITKLVEATERVTQGDLASKAEIVREDEIGLLARRFNEMLDRLNRSLSDQRRFYADASHELRTPLTIIRGEADVALRGAEKSVGEYRDALETIVAVASQMGRMVDELLFLARSEAGHIHYEMAKIALPPLLREVARQSEGLAALKGVELNLDVGRPIVVWGDLWHLRQLVFILVDNAVKYTESGGRATLTLESAPDRARLLVSDTGTGIANEELRHIFERFYRGRAARLTHEQGTGLGLSIAKSIVKAHKGTISVESELGRGTTVSVTLRRA